MSTSPHSKDFMTTLITNSVILSCRLWQNLPIVGPNSISVRGSEKFLKMLETRPLNQPIITVSNHTATIDDPMIWSVLPLRIWSNPHRLGRWVLGAKEICFKNKAVGYFFGKGQTLPIVRGIGVHQEGMEMAIDKLNSGSWIHIFPEGKVNQQHSMIRFKWGIGRLIMESKVTPWVVPIYQRGMEQVLPLGKPFPPRFGKDLVFSFGDPVDFGPILKQMDDHDMDVIAKRIKTTWIVSDMVHALEWKTREWWAEELARKRLGREPEPVRYLQPNPDVAPVNPSTNESTSSP